MTELNETMRRLRSHIPTRMRRLPIAPNGFLVPFFVAWLQNGKEMPAGQGEPDFRVIGGIVTPDGKRLESKVSYCHRLHRCWLCGEPLGRYSTFTIGPMCVVNRVSSEPPSHQDCARFAAEACPFLTKPRMKRNEKDLPAETGTTAGIPIDRNPGVMCVWTTERYKIFKPHSGGVLFDVGEPYRIEFYCEGRAATRAELMESITTGLPLLTEIAAKEGALSDLEKMRLRAMRLIDAHFEEKVT
jgi:hypothetical protein